MLRVLGAYDNARLVGEVEGAYHFVSTKSETHLAPDVNVLLSAAADGIGLARKSELLERRAGAYSLGTDFPVRQSVRNGALSHLGLLGGVGKDAEQVDWCWRV